MGFLTGKRALIIGLLSNRSIAHGIASAMHREGAELAFTYQNEKVKDRVAKMIKEFGSSILLPCDVTDDAQIEQVFTELKKEWGQLDILVHSVAYAPADQLDGNYVDVVTREGFHVAHDISSYSFAALAKAAAPMMSENGAMVTMTYAGGSMRVSGTYNVMGVAKASLEANMRYLAYSLGTKGIRVNAVSPGPIKTLAASGVKGFKKMLTYDEEVNPLHRNVTTADVGNTTAFLCSDLARGITGEIVHVDSGYHIMGVPPLGD